MNLFNLKTLYILNDAVFYRDSCRKKIINVLYIFFYENIFRMFLK